MLKTLVLLCFAFTLGGNAFSQQLASGECGIVNVYDKAGNRIRREYFCNDGQDPYPQKIKQTESNELMEVQPVDALYPNPTSGKFSVTFSRPLKEAKVSLTDVNGKVVQQFRGTGYRLDFDLSTVAAGVYLVHIEENGTVITKKVVKQ